VFYALYVGGGVGLPRQAREALLDQIGLRTDIFASDILTNLAPGRVAQVTWYVVLGSAKEPDKTSLGSHAFLIGRFKDRDVWFLSDQGASPAVELEAPDLTTLKQQALATKRYWPVRRRTG
jgi:hypothetical protein